jgi:hypothetical protein
MPKKEEKPIVDLAVSNPEEVKIVGTDCGTMNIVSACRSKDGHVDTKLLRNVYLPIEVNQLALSELNNLDHVTDDKMVYIIGEDAYRLANIFGHKVRRPMSQGLISSEDIDGLDVLALMMEQLVGRTKNGFCVYSVPAPSVDKQNDITYHKGVFKRIFSELGYNKCIEFNESAAIIYSECQDNNFTGLAFSFGAGMCLRGNTEIILANGTKKTIKELSQLGPDNKFWVLSCKEDGSIVPAKAYNCHKTKNDELYRVWLDNKKYVDCTKEHPFMMRDGSYKQAQFLNCGDSLMPIYISNAIYDGRKGYFNIIDNVTKKPRSLHRLLFENYYNVKLSSNNILHHKDFNPSNNEPINLILTDRTDHLKYHQPGIEWVRSHLKDKTYEECFGTEKANKIKQKQSNKHKRIENCGRFKKGHIAFNKNKKYEDIFGFELAQQFKEKISNTIRNNPVARKPFKKRETRICICGCNSEFTVIETSPRKYYKSSCCHIGKQKFMSQETRDKISNTLKHKYINHKVVKIEKLNISEDVYDITVEDYHNFALSCGVFVHNSNVSLCYKATQVLNFSVARGGDWIDDCVSRSLAIVPNRVTSIKENNTDLMNYMTGEKKERRIREAIAYYYKEMINYTLGNIKNKISKELANVELPDALPIIISGGTSKAKGFQELFTNIVEEYRSDLPFQIKEIRIASDPMTAVAEGCLIKAISEQGA